MATVALILIGPIFYVVAVILFFSFGLAYIINGYRRDKDGKRNPKKVASGFIFMGVSNTMVALVVLLFVWLATHPIAFM